MHTKIEKQWTTESGHKALIVMTTMGTRNGYIEIALDPLLEAYCSSVSFEDIQKWTPDLIAKQEYINDISVHGGITFLGELVGGTRAVGFDCNHAWDAPDWDTADELFGDDPDYLKHLASRKSMKPFDDEVVRTLSYVIEQCESLSTQLTKLP